jgi:hypothetical protein
VFDLLASWGMDTPLGQTVVFIGETQSLHSSPSSGKASTEVTGTVQGVGVSTNRSRRCFGVHARWMDSQSLAICSGVGK